MTHPLDIALESLRTIAENDFGGERVEITVRSDGRVHMRVDGRYGTIVTLKTDLAPDSALPMPSEALDAGKWTRVRT